MREGVHREGGVNEKEEKNAQESTICFKKDQEWHAGTLGSKRQLTQFSRNMVSLPAPFAMAIECIPRFVLFVSNAQLDLKEHWLKKWLRAMTAAFKSASYPSVAREVLFQERQHSLSFFLSRLLMMFKWSALFFPLFINIKVNIFFRGDSLTFSQKDLPKSVHQILHFFIISFKIIKRNFKQSFILLGRHLSRYVK